MITTVSPPKLAYQFQIHAIEDWHCSESPVDLKTAGLTLPTAVNTPKPIPTPIPGAAKNASPLPNVPNNPPPTAATTAPTAAYLAYRINRRMTYLSTYLPRQHLPLFHVDNDATVPP